jgi:methionyl-tRNA formyltransferase
MNVVFCGTGAFGLPALRALAASEFRPRLVVTQPDRPAGRSRDLKASAIKTLAAELGVEVFQPERINRDEALARLRAEAPDFLLVVAYGQILRKAVLDLPRLMCVNLHGSALPRWRGAAPIAAALAAGDAESGVTAMRMDEGLDTGPILAVTREAVRPDDDAGTLHDRLADMGGAMIVDVLRRVASGALRPTPQDDAAATVCRTLDRADGRLDWTRPAAELERRVRAMRPWPGAWTTVRRADGTSYELGVLKAAVADAVGGAAPGTVLAAEGDACVVAAGGGALRLTEVKPAGKSAMEIGAFLRGRRLSAGDRCD